LLLQSGFLVYQKLGRLKIYQTTKKFQDYFGIEGDIEILKKKLVKTETSAAAPQIVQPMLEKA